MSSRKKDDQHNKSKSGNKDRVGMNSDRDDSRKGTQASGRQKSDDLDAGYHVGSGTGAHQRSDPSHRR